MSPLEQLRAAQHNDLRLASDARLDAFLAEADPTHVLTDRLPATAIERRHLEHARRTA